MTGAPDLAAIARDEELDDIRAVMALPRGRRLMWRLLGHCQIFRDAGPAAGDVHNYHAGRRGVGLFLYSEIKDAAPDDFRKMEFENTTLAAALIEHQEMTAKAEQPEDVYT